MVILPPEEGYLRNEVTNIMGGHELVTPTTILLDQIQQERENAARERLFKEQEQLLKEQALKDLEKWKSLALSLEKR